MTSQPILVFLLDETGSMNSHLQTTISAFNEYTDSLRREKPELRVTLTLFSTGKHETLATLLPIAQLPALSTSNYHPNGGTPLYDAIGRVVTETEIAVTGMKAAGTDPDVLVTILTDGEENSSKEFSRDAIFRLIQRKEAEDWTFVYLGADHDAWAVASSIGVRADRAKQFKKEFMQEEMDDLGRQSISHLATPRSERRNAAFFSPKPNETKER